MAITMGDASGVGPEIVLRRVAGRRVRPATVVVYGDAGDPRTVSELLGVDVEIEAITIRGAMRPDVACTSSTPRLLRLPIIAPESSMPSSGPPPGIRASATIDALDGRVAGIVTMPMNKEATQLSDPAFVGHTEMIAELCGVQRFTMMLTAGDARGHTRQHALCRCERRSSGCEPSTCLDVIELTDETLHRFLDRPRIAVCGLNPHAGEHGLFGSEDAEQIAPAIEAAPERADRRDGPHPADTVFHRGSQRQRFDAIVCMYHDQGHAPMKLLAFEEGVNVTLGLPIIRTSVDHGTAFDIAWKGVAFTGSLDHALQWARRLAGPGQ